MPFVYADGDADGDAAGERVGRINQYAQSTACPDSLTNRMMDVAGRLAESYEGCDTSSQLLTCERALDLCGALDEEAATTQRMSTRGRTKARREGLEPPSKMSRTSASKNSALHLASMPEDISYVAMATEIANAAACALDHTFTALMEMYDFGHGEEEYMRDDWSQVFSLLQHPAFCGNRHPALQAALLHSLYPLIKAHNYIISELHEIHEMHEDDEMLDRLHAQLRAQPREQQQLITLIQQPGVAPAVLAAASLALVQTTYGSLLPHHAANMAAALQAALLASSADQQHMPDIARCLVKCCQSCQSSAVWLVLQPQAAYLLHHLLHILQTVDPADEYYIRKEACWIEDLILDIMQQLDKSAAMQALLKQAAQQLVRTAAQFTSNSCDLYDFMLGSSSGLAELASLAAGVVSMQQLRNITNFTSNMLSAPSIMRWQPHRAQPSQDLHSVLQPLLQLYLNWSTDSIRLADRPQNASRQPCHQPAQDAAADRAEAHASLASVLQKCCRMVSLASGVPHVAAGVDTAILLTAAKARHWGLANEVACLMCSRNGNIREAQQGDAASSDAGSELRESASAAIEVLMMMNSGSSGTSASGSNSQSIDAQNSIYCCRTQLVQVLLHFGCVAGQELQHVLASTGMIKHLCGLLTLAAEHQAAAAQQAGPSARRPPASAQVSGIITTIKSIKHPAAQLLYDAGALSLMEQMMQEYPEPDNSKLYVDLQLIWLAAALRCPANLACEVGHQAMMAQLSEKPEMPGCAVAYTALAVNAAGVLQGIRWMVDNDPSFVTSPALLQYLRQLRKPYSSWIIECTAGGVTMAGRRAQVQAICTMYNLLTQVLALDNQALLTPEDCRALVPRNVMQMLIQMDPPNSITLMLQSGVADALVAAAQLVRYCKQHGSGSECGKCTMLASLLGVRAVENRSKHQGLDALWNLLGADVFGDSTQQLDAACAQLLAALLDMGLMSVPSGLPALTVSKLCRMLASWVERVQGQPQGKQQEDGIKADRGVVCSVAACLCAVAGCSNAMQLTLLENVHVLPALSTMLRLPHLEGAALKLLGQLTTSSDRQGQGLVSRQQELLSGLVHLLGHGMMRCKVIVLLRALMLGNGSAQLAVACVPGMCAGLVQLLGCDECEVADEAAETLAALQHDSSEAQALVKRAGRGVVMALQ